MTAEEVFTFQAIVDAFPVRYCSPETRSLIQHMTNYIVDLEKRVIALEEAAYFQQTTAGVYRR